MLNSDQPFAQEGYELMGAAFEVHNVQGGGLLEEIYQQSLEPELESGGIPDCQDDFLEANNSRKTTGMSRDPWIMVRSKIPFSIGR